MSEQTKKQKNTKIPFLAANKDDLVIEFTKEINRVASMFGKDVSDFKVTVEFAQPDPKGNRLLLCDVVYTKGDLRR